MIDRFDELTSDLKPLSSIGRPWYICGGWAIDLFLGRVSREHSDIDIAIARCDQLIFQQHLQGLGWHLSYIEGRIEQPWTSGVILDQPIHEVWSVRGKTKTERIELLLNEIEDEQFRFRRDTQLSMPLVEAWHESWPGLRALAPEIVLLYKASQALDTRETADFNAVLPCMSAASRHWLRIGLEGLYTNHPWLIDLV